MTFKWYPKTSAKARIPALDGFKVKGLSRRNLTENDRTCQKLFYSNWFSRTWVMEVFIQMLKKKKEERKKKKEERRRSWICSYRPARAPRSAGKNEHFKQFLALGQSRRMVQETKIALNIGKFKENSKNLFLPTLEFLDRRRTKYDGSRYRDI